MSIRKFILAIGLLISGCVCSQNEDFESSPTGPITTSTQVQGWLFTSATNTNFANTCTRFCDSLLVPLEAEIMNNTNSLGYIDTIIGSQYPLFSVFGSNLNSGTNYNSNIANMYGTTFLRLGRVIDASYACANFYQTATKVKVNYANCVFRYAYVYVGKAAWNCCIEPLFKVRVSNITNSTTVNSYSRIVSPILGCATSSADVLHNDNSWFGGKYSKWKIVTLDLSNFIGDSIKLEFCAGNRHTLGSYCYVYLDTKSEPGLIHCNGIINTSGTAKACSTLTLSAPIGFNYSWNGPATNNATTQAIAIGTSGVYSLTMSQGTTAIANQTIDVTIVQPLSLGFTISKDTICSGESTTLTIDYNDVGHIQTFTWWNPASASPSIVVSPTITNNYCLSGTDINNCETQSCKTIYVNQCVGLKEVEISTSKIDAHPNPNSGDFAIKSQSNEEVFIFDNLGKLLQTIKLTDENDHVAHLSGFEPGLYFVRSMEKVFKLTVID